MFDDLTFDNDETIENLLRTNCINIPTYKGVYVIYTPNDFEINFNNSTIAITEFKGQNMLYHKDILKQKYDISDKKILYIGKASGQRGLNQRLQQMIRYGYHNGTNKRGGRAIWQISNCEKLHVGCFLCENPRVKEVELITSYLHLYGVYPVANMTT